MWIGNRNDIQDAHTIVMVGIDQKLALRQEITNRAIGVRRRHLLVVVPVCVAISLGVTETRKRVKCRPVKNRSPVQGEKSGQQ